MATHVTVMLLNWKRPENLRERVIPSLLRQSAKPFVFLWNNGAPFQCEGLDWQIDSSTNKRCFPRWYMAMMAETEYVCSLDDDIELADEHVLRDVMDRYAERYAGRVVGSHGVILKSGCTYKDSIQVASDGKGDQAVDIVKGRMMFFSRELLRKVDMTPEFEDDIKLCSRIAGGQRMHHIVLSLLGGRTNDLPEHGVALCEQPGQPEVRNLAAKKYFSW